MNENFCLSPWRTNCFGDDFLQFRQFQKERQQKTNKNGRVREFLSARQTQTIRNARKSIQIKSSRLNSKQSESKQNSRARLHSIKVTSHKSAQITPSKKQPMRIHKITYGKNLKLGAKKKQWPQNTKDRHQILIDKFVKMKKEGKLQFKQSIGQRILRF